VWKKGSQAPGTRRLLKFRVAVASERVNRTTELPGRINRCAKRKCARAPLDSPETPVRGRLEREEGQVLLKLISRSFASQPQQRPGVDAKARPR